MRGAAQVGSTLFSKKGFRPLPKVVGLLNFVRFFPSEFHGTFYSIVLLRGWPIQEQTRVSVIRYVIGTVRPCLVFEPTCARMGHGIGGYLPIS